MTNENGLNKNPRVYSVEFWRFAFTVIVALYHLEIFFQRKLMPSGTTVVEFFFILAGFTIAMSAAGRVEKTGKRELSAKEAHAIALDYMKKKLAAIYPLMAVTLVVAVVVIPIVAPPVMPFSTPVSAGLLQQIAERVKNLFNSEWEWLIMVGTPMGFNGSSASLAPIVPLWFLTQLLAVGYLYTFLINRKYDIIMFAAPLIAVFGLVYFVMHSENILEFYVRMGFLNAGTVRALSEMALGIAIFQLYSHMKGRKWALPGKIMLQLLELLAIYRYYVLTLEARVSIDNFSRIPYVLIIILLSFSNLTFLSKLLNRRFMEKLGKISLPMYLIHFPVASLYISLLYRLKGSRIASSLPLFILRSGGTNENYQPITLSIGDVVMYLPLVIAACVLLYLFVAGIARIWRVIRTARLDKSAKNI